MGQANGRALSDHSIISISIRYVAQNNRISSLYSHARPQPFRLNCKYSFHNRKFARCRRSDLAWVKSQQSRVLVSLVFLSIPLHSAQLLAVYLQREAKHASFNQEHSRRWNGNISHLRAKKCISQAIIQCTLSFSVSHTHTDTHTLSIPHTEAPHCIIGHCMQICVMTFWTLWRGKESDGWAPRWQRPRSCSKSKH